ncbi:hypothetical protein GJ633_09400 [Halorubrum sp. CBA1125]|uniref:hypothetical protein n=1 Tax=Halorubrum sp. CBA1125 TaxID=2668072 RepID=UPI0012E87466|nr:hypothetical protein [Halorubrum sp. CBA1125]MUW14855.1 hypothetical protein [Halorubrum sp. CBA1125]
MGLTKTQDDIERAILAICRPESPLATVEDIAENASVSDQTVRNNADAVVEQNKYIESKTVGQANIYYVKRSLADEIWNSETETLFDLQQSNGDASYAEVRDAEDSSFDLEVRYYDREAEVIEDYVPTSEELGRIASSYGVSPVAIKFYGPF